jgi:sugar phosphate isomerase/epimerase
MLTRRKFLGTSALSLGAFAVSGYTPAGETTKTLPFRISLNVSTIRTYKLPVDRQIEVCGAAGFDGIELWIPDIQDYTKNGGSLSNLAAKLKDNNLILENVIGFAQWAADDDNRREAGVEQMQREMETAAALGGKYIAAPMMGISQFEKNRLDEYAQRYLRIIEAGKALGITPLLEIWGSGALNKLADAAYIAIATGHPDANLLLDFYHLYRGGNSFDSLNLIDLARLPLIHANDYPADPPREQLKDSDRVYPGDGVCPFHSVIPQLYSGGFRGAFSVELFNEGYCRNNTVEQVLATTIEKTKKVLTIKI